MSTDELQLLRQHAGEVHAWFALHPDGPADARSPELSPGVVPHEEIGRSWKALRTSCGAMDAMLDTVAARRRALLPGAGVRAAPPAGRWAVYDPDSSDFSQLARSETNGLFDDADCPGWDLWVACIGTAETNVPWSRSLVVWVPETLVERFDRGLSMMPTSAVLWVDDPFLRRWPTGRVLEETLRAMPG